jgi:hypothetical protein
MPDARSLLQSAIKAAGGDGLCNPDADCGCEINDLAPGWDCIDLDGCQAAKWIAEGNEEYPDGYFKVLG